MVTGDRGGVRSPVSSHHVAASCRSSAVNPSFRASPGRPYMATFERPKAAESVPLDLLAVIRASGVLPEKALAEIRTKILQGDYPMDSVELAERLVKDRILTAYQTKRFLSNRAHGLIVGR